MTKTEALKQDKSFYVEFDDESGAYCVFGENSGFAYASYASSVEAEAKSKEMNIATLSEAELKSLTKVYKNERRGIVSAEEAKAELLRRKQK